MRTSLALTLMLTACGSTPPASTNDSPASSEAGSGSETEASSETDSLDAAEADAETNPFPPTVNPGQGEHAVGVYLARVEDAASTTALMERLDQRGVENAGSGELGCDHGAAEALSIPAETVVVSVAFATREDAERFVELWGEPVLGVAELVAYCRD